MRIVVPFFLLLLAIGAGCHPAYVLQMPPDLLLQSNLRFNRRGVGTSVQSWRGTTVLPACSEVHITDISRGEIRFTSYGNEYRYILHRSTNLPVGDHVERYFGETCPLEQLSDIDQQGVELGQPLIGMSREGVLRAVAHPPEHRTPNLSDPEWTYWGEEGNVIVHFTGDVVTNVNDPAHPEVVAQEQPTVAVVTPQPTGAQPAGGVVVVDHNQSTNVVDPNANRNQPAVNQAPPRESRRARRRRRRRAAVGVAVTVGAVAGTVAVRRGNERRANQPVAQPPAQAQPAQRRPAPSGCITRTFNGTSYADVPGSAIGQACQFEGNTHGASSVVAHGAGGCPADYGCHYPMDICVPVEPSVRCTD